MHNDLIEREAYKEIAKHLNAPEITILTGARQVGKTTLLYQLKDYLINKKVSEKDIHIFNLDILSDLEGLQSQHDFINFIKSRTTKKRIYIFVDEVQRLKNPGIFFKGIFDLQLPVKFVLTGSSSIEIKAKIREPLTGRKRLFHLYPFSFYEFLKAKNEVLLSIIKNNQISSIDKHNLFVLLNEYQIYGGYPKVVLETNHEEKIKLLNEIYSSYVEKDIVGLLKIKNPISFSKLTSLLASQIGQLLNINELSRTLGIQIKTTKHYLSFLEKTFVITLLRPYFKNFRKEIIKMPKIFFIDLGIRNSSIYAFQSMDQLMDKGILLENFVFDELQRINNISVKFWRTKMQSEIDFILECVDGRIVPLEVKASNLKKPVISRSFRSFISQYSPQKAYIVNLGLQTKIKVNSTEVYFIHPYEIRSYATV